MMANWAYSQTVSPPKEHDQKWKHYAGFFDDTIADMERPTVDCEPYARIREADIVWSKVVYRDLDRQSPFNKRFFEPAADSLGELFDILIKAYKDELIMPFNSSGDEEGEFLNPMRPGQCDSICFSVAHKILDSNNIPVAEEWSFYSPDDVVAYRLKEYWYFDARIGGVSKRIIGIMPLMLHVDDDGETEVRNSAWFYYPEIKSILCRAFVKSKNPNDVKLSFDKLLSSGRYKGTFVDEGDVFNRSEVETGYHGYDLYGRSQEIKQFLHNKEIDLWEH